MLQIRNPVTALSLDLACTLRLLRFDTEVMEAQAKRIAFEVSKLFADPEEIDGGAQEW